ncbi:nucleoside-diphosphate-sugar epimerase [Acidovorax delafieldii]|nr:nucleoside-diphosphate-sugar epimerase [Acidovorax delafieldii]
MVELASSAYPSSAISYENNSECPHEAGWLALETAHARHVLGVAPHWSLNTAVARTMNWYRQQHGGADARALCIADIDAWEARP